MDDLRASSEVIVWLTMLTGDVELHHIPGGFGINSSVSRHVTFRDANKIVDSCKVTGVKVQMVSRNEGNNVDETWNLDGFTIHGYAKDGRVSYYLNANGKPLKRFTSRSQWWEKQD